MAELKLTILGCGSSGGVPRIGGLWGDCDPANPRNARTRCSMLVERLDGDAATRVLIDTSPDLRTQLLASGTSDLDGVIYTHQHADHTHGLDDLRVVVINKRERLPVWADAPTIDALTTRFAYAFEQPEWSSYPPILEMNEITGDFEVPGPAGPIAFHPFSVIHGGILSLGFRFHDIAYLPDVSKMPDGSWPAVGNLQLWILDALRRKPHPTHIHLDQALDWIDRMKPKRAILTNMHIDLDYETLLAETPDHVEPAYDGLSVSFEI